MISNFRYQLVNNPGDILFCNLLESEKILTAQVDVKSIKLCNGKLRGGMAKVATGRVYMFSRSKDYILSSTKFRTCLDVVASALPEVAGQVLIQG
jgi:hypothetical protein